MSKENKDTIPYDDEITLKELILKIQEYGSELLRHWKLIALISIPFVAYKLYDALTTPVTYRGELTFMVDEEEAGNSAYSSILGQLGMGGFGMPSQYNLDKILEISKSRRVIQMALFSQGEVDGLKDYVANHIIDHSDMRKKWAKKKDDTTNLVDFRFTRHDFDQFTKRENSILKSVIRTVLGSEKIKGMYQTTYDDNTGIMKLAFNGRDEDLSIVFLDTIFHKLKEYYIDKSIEKAKSTYQIVKDKTDSLAQELAAAEYSLASFMDRSQNIYSAREGELQRSRLSANVSRLQIMYGEALRNQQFAELSLKNKEPFIALIDSPLSPIGPNKKSMLRAIIIGLILGVMVGITFVLGRKIYRDAMNS